MFAKTLIAATVLTLSISAQAGIVVGGSTLIDTAGQSQLENWLGQGELTLTNIFTKTSNSYAADFHNAADGKGATFVLMNASEDGINWKTIGGYDPVSWNTSPFYNMAGPHSAFVFNLTDGVVRAQTDSYQTVNSSGYGPTFGGGHDIYVDYDLNFGYSYGYSYGNGGGLSLVDGSNFDGVNMQIRDLEVFSIDGFTGQAVPEPSSVFLLGMGLIGLVASRRKKAAQA